MKHLMKLKQTFKARFHVPVPKKSFFLALGFFHVQYVCMFTVFPLRVLYPKKG